MEENSMRCVGWRADLLQNCPKDEGDVSIECLQSSEFVIGKQANFNGAVTIINCEEASGTGGKGGEDRKPEGTEEKIIIKDKVLTPVQEVDGKFVGLIKTLKKWRADRKKMMLLALSVFICIGILTIAVCLVVLLPKEQKVSSGGMGSTAHPFYSKADWKGKPPTSVVKIKLPVPYAVVSHTVTPICRTLRACSALLQNMQGYHWDLNFSDIAYNFLVDAEGGIYEGRGWESRNVNTGFVHGRSVDVALIGSYSDAQPSKKLMDGLRYLLDYGLDHGKLSLNYTLLAANQTFGTESPGKHVYDIIKDWPHFDPDPKAHVKDLDEQ